MKFVGIVMFSAGASVVWGMGCKPVPECPDPTAPQINGQYQWIWENKPACPSRPASGDSGPPPEPEKDPIPDVSTVAPIDPPGPKSPDGVVNAAIAYISCYNPRMLFTDLNINRQISGLYYAQYEEPMTLALSQRTSCFANMTAGCGTFRECMGVSSQISSPTGAVPCENGIAFRGFDIEWGGRGYRYENCAALGYECRLSKVAETPYGFCEHPNGRECVGVQGSSTKCINGEFYACQYASPDPVDGYMADLPSCSEFGYVCSDFAGHVDNYCKAPGPSCDSVYLSTDDRIFDYRQGHECLSETTMRACVNGGEDIVDCTSMAADFTCRKGPMPGVMDFICARGDECTEFDDTYCDGSSLVVCDAGKIRKVDCKALGFTGCNAKYAYCESTVFHGP